MLHRCKQLAPAAVVLAALPLSWACSNDVLNPPTPSTDAIFARYVSIGNGITAGFQSGGINDSTQNESYAVLLARQMDTEFIIPRLADPGCPPLIVNIFTLERVGGASDTDCAFRAETVKEVPTHINNVAVPGAAVLDAVSNIAQGNRANALTTFILGGMTQLEVARKVKPTFMTVWIGNNDILGAALTGDLATLTDPAVFAERYSTMMDGVDAMGVEAGVLVSVARVTAAPFLSAGAAYWQAEALGTLPPTLDVLDNCAPTALGGSGETSFVPFSYGFGVLRDSAQLGFPVTLDCVNADSVLVTSELLAVVQAVGAYNATIQAEATERGWAYVDLNALVLEPLLLGGDIAPFPNLGGIEELIAPFGSALSRDGVHPSASTHKLIANAIMGAINTTYDTDLELLP